MFPAGWLVKDEVRRRSCPSGRLGPSTASPQCETRTHTTSPKSRLLNTVIPRSQPLRPDPSGIGSTPPFGIWQAHASPGPPAPVLVVDEQAPVYGDRVDPPIAWPLGLEHLDSSRWPGIGVNPMVRSKVLSADVRGTRVDTLRRSVSSLTTRDHWRPASVELIPTPEPGPERLVDGAAGLSWRDVRLLRESDRNRQVLGVAATNGKYTVVGGVQGRRIGRAARAQNRS